MLGGLGEKQVQGYLFDWEFGEAWGGGRSGVSRESATVLFVSRNFVPSASRETRLFGLFPPFSGFLPSWSIGRKREGM